MGVASEVPPQVLYAEFALVTSFRPLFPVADQPTVTISGSSRLAEFGPRLDQGAASPQVPP